MDPALLSNTEDCWKASTIPGQLTQRARGNNELSFTLAMNSWTPKPKSKIGKILHNSSPILTRAQWKTQEVSSSQNWILILTFSYRHQIHSLHAAVLCGANFYYTFPRSFIKFLGQVLCCLVLLVYSIYQFFFLIIISQVCCHHNG